MKYAYQRWLIIASICHISIGVFIGFLMYVSQAIDLNLPLSDMRSVHIHQILFGGVIQMIMGVALWMFPRMKNPPHYTSKFKGMLLFIMLNTGVLLRSIFELAGRDQKMYFYMALLGVILQVISMFYFFVLVISRIRKP